MARSSTTRRSASRRKTALRSSKAVTDAGIIPGIKVDTGAKDLAGHPGEKITEGLDGLRDRLAEYSQMGARFAKWRAVIAIGEGIPSRGCIEANAHALARYAASCQEAGLVPIVEPEVLMDGEHTMERCREVTEEVLRTVFDQLYPARGDAGGRDPEAQYGASGIDLPQAGLGGRGRRRHRALSLASRPRCRSGDCVLVGRPISGTGFGASERHECQIQIAVALGVGVLVCPRDPATGFGDLARPRGEGIGGTAGFVSPSHVQPGCAPGRIQCRDGETEHREASRHLRSLRRSKGRRSTL